MHNGTVMLTAQVDRLENLMKIILKREAVFLQPPISAMLACRRLLARTSSQHIVTGSHARVRQASTSTREARSLAEASSLASLGGPHVLLLRASEDLLCRNMMCEKLGGACICRLALTLSRCSQLRSLDIAANALAELPDAVFERASLQQLDLSNNALTAVPASLRLLAQLEDLNIAGNPLQLSVDHITALPLLKRLSISQAQLQQCGGMDVLRKELPHVSIEVVPVG
jgi:Leucine rich repeat